MPGTMVSAERSSAPAPPMPSPAHRELNGDPAVLADDMMGKKKRKKKGRGARTNNTDNDTFTPGPTLVSLSPWPTEAAVQETTAYLIDRELADVHARKTVSLSECMTLAAQLFETADEVRATSARLVLTAKNLQQLLQAGAPEHSQHNIELMVQQTYQFAHAASDGSEQLASQMLHFRFLTQTGAFTWLSKHFLDQLNWQYLEAMKSPHSKPQRVQEIIDNLAEAVKETPAIDPLYNQAVQQLHKWCRKSKSLPSSCMLADTVELESPCRPLSSSGQSDVYRGHLRGTPVALKALRVHVDDCEAIQRSYRNEVVTWKCLRHPNIVPFLGISQLFPVCIVSEWMPQGTISAFLKSHPDQSRSPYIEQIVCGLEFMHDLGVIHGDLKPANILLDEEGNARLTDFGMATVLYNSSTQSASATGNPFGGTVRYMAPELLLGSEGTKLNVQTDIYALAITLWELFAGEIPYPLIPREPAVLLKVLVKGERPLRPAASVDVGLTDEVWHLMKRGWAHKPARRPALVKFWHAVAPDVIRLRKLALDLQQGPLDAWELELTRRGESIMHTGDDRGLHVRVITAEELRTNKLCVTRTQKDAEQPRQATLGVARPQNDKPEEEIQMVRREAEATRREVEVDRREAVLAFREAELARREAEIAQLVGLH